MNITNLAAIHLFSYGNAHICSITPVDDKKNHYLLEPVIYGLLFSDVFAANRNSNKRCLNFSPGKGHNKNRPSCPLSLTPPVLVNQATAESKICSTYFNTSVSLIITIHFENKPSLRSTVFFIFYFLFLLQRLLLGTPDLPEVQKIT